jgi:hypothetical protein
VTDRPQDAVNWRVVSAGLLLAASLWVLALGGFGPTHSGAPPAPEWHVNVNGGFKILPPPEWTSRTDDRDGTQIAPPVQPTFGFATMIVSVRLASDPDPMAHLTQAAARAPAGPVRDLKWTKLEKVTMGDGHEGVLGEFTQVYRGAPVHGWMVIAVRDARLLQAVATVPAERAAAWGPTLVTSLQSLEAL